MKYFIILILCCTTSLALAERYGAPVETAKAVSLDAAIKQLEGTSAVDVVIESKVDKVCVVKGCWMALTNTKDDVRVTFKDYGFFVPATVIGKTVRVQGTLEKVVMTLEDTKHYVKDAGGDPSKVTEPRTEYRIVATGVEVRT